MNDTGLDDTSAGLPSWALYPLTLVLALIFLYVLYRQRRFIVKMALFIPWVRYLAAFFHQWTFVPIAGGMSPNALLAAGVFVFGLSVVKKKHLLLKFLLPCYLVMFVILLSGLANHAVGGTIDAVVKFGYLIVVCLTVFEALSAIGEPKMSKLLLWPFVMPVVFQMISVVLGVKKIGEDSDSSISYVGGYNHEGAFSIIMTTGLVISSFATDLKRPVRLGIFFICVASIVLANYRTTILAIAPIVLIQLNQDLLSPFRRAHRPVVVVITGILSVIAVGAAAYALRDRFDTLLGAFEPWDRLLKPPYEYTDADKLLLTGRAATWSVYIYAWHLSGTLQHLIGFGANSWQGVFDHYAHNTLVSALYEYGPPGVIAILLMWTTMIVTALRIKNGPRPQLVAAHLGFIILNMATMPHWLVEGDILYGVICGYTCYWRLKGGQVAAAAAAAVQAKPGRQRVQRRPGAAPAPNPGQARLAPGGANAVKTRP